MEVTKAKGGEKEEQVKRKEVVTKKVKKGTRE